MRTRSCLLALGLLALAPALVSAQGQTGPATPAAAATAAAYGTLSPALDRLSTAAGSGVSALVSIDPSAIALSDAASVLDLRVTGSPPLVGFTVELAFDPAVVWVADVTFDRMLVSTGGTLQSDSMERPDAGRIRLSADLADATSPLPSGDGVLAQIQVYPVHAGSSGLSVESAELRTNSGGSVESVPVDVAPEPSQVIVSAEPPAALQTEVAALAADERPSVVGIPGLTLPTLDFSTRQLVWLGVLLGSAVVVALGWLIGRGSEAPRP